MKLEKSKFNLLLAKWIKWDKDLWNALRDIQVKILYERIIEEQSYAELAKIYKVSESKMKTIFRAIIIRLEKDLGKGIAFLLRDINANIEKQETGKSKSTSNIGFDFNTIYLN